MSYIGRQPTVGNFQICDAISVVNGQAAYTMQVGSVNVSPESANHMIVSLNGVIQKPTDAFTVSGSVITFASALVTGDVINFIQILGNVLDLGVPSDGTVTAAKIGANAVTNAKLNNDIISGATELASEPADTDEFLVSDAGTLKRIDYSLIKPSDAFTNVDRWTMSNQNYSEGDTMTTGWSRVTTLNGMPFGTGLTQSSGIFTFPTTGLYKIDIMSYVYNGNNTHTYVGIAMKGTNDAFSSNTQSLGVSYNQISAAQAHGNIAEHTLYKIDNTSNNKFKLMVETNTGSPGFYQTYITFMRLGDG